MNLITVVDNGNSPIDVEFVGGASLGYGVLVDATYPSVVIEMSGNVKFTPNSPTLLNTERGLLLGPSLVVSGASVGQFRMNADNQIQDDGAACGLNSPAFSFS